MDIGHVLHLIEALKDHPLLGLDISPEYLHNLLRPAEVPASRRFYHGMEDNRYHLPNKPGQSRTFSIDLILRNNVAKGYMKTGYTKSPVTRLKSKLSSKRSYDPVELSRSLRSDPRIVEIMADALVAGEVAFGPNYSALGRIETVDDITGKFERRPIVAIARRDHAPITQEDASRLTKWETENTQYGIRHPIGTETPLTREQYLKTP